MAIPLRVLVLEDRPEDAELMLHELRRAGYEPSWVRVETESEYLACLDPALDLILADYRLPQFDGLRALDLLQKRGLDIPFILVSGTIGEELAVSAMKKGAADYLLKDRLARLGPAVARALEQKRLREEKQRADEALRESEEKYRSLVERANDGIAIIQDGIVKYVNARLAEIWGGSVEEIIGTPFTDHIDPDELPKVVERYNRRMAGEDVPSIYETVLRRRDGSTVSVELNAGIIAYQGRPADLAMVRDITERKRAEERILESERFLADIFASIQDGISVLDCDLTVIRVNPALERWYAHAMPLVGKKCYTAYHGRSEPCEVCPTRRTLETGKPAREVIPKRGSDGKIVRWVDLFSFPLLDRETGQLKGVIEYARDVTEHKQAEEALQLQTSYFRQLFESSPDGIALLDMNGRVIEVNRAFEEKFQYSADELKGHFLPDIIVPEDRREESSALLRQAQQGKVARQQTVRKRKDGNLLDVIILSHPIVVDDKPVGIYVLYVDTTEQRKLEKQLLQAQKMEAIGRLAGGVAHDFNNLLTVITGYSEMVLNQLKERDPRRRQVEEIKRAGERAAALTRQLLIFSRRHVAQPIVLNLNAVVSDMDKMLRRLIGEDIELRTIVDRALGQIKADPAQIEQVIMNLAVNARDAMPRGGRLTIETANVDLDEAYASRHIGVKPGPYVMLAVSDTGCGMDAETMSHIFEPFFTTKAEGQGTGLGLSTVYGIVEQSGGHIEVYSEVGRGTTFKIYLPRIEEAAELLKPSALSTELPRGVETILLVEDEATVRDLAQEILQASGYTVLTAREGEEALQLAEAHDGPIHLLLTDVVMPQMSGPEVANRLAAAHPEMRVLYMSGYTSKAAAQYQLLNPGAPLLRKPFTVEALARKVREVLEARDSEELCQR